MIWYDIRYDMIWYDMIWYDMINLSTAIGLTPGGCSTVHIYTQTIHRTTQIQTIHRTRQITTEQHKQLIWKSAGRNPSLRVLPRAFALQLRKKHGKTSVRVAEKWQYTYYQNTHTLQNNMKPPQYKSKQTQYKIHPNENSHNIQGGSNMTGTNLYVNKCKQSRSYLNHLAVYVQINNLPYYLCHTSK